MTVGTWPEKIFLQYGDDFDDVPDYAERGDSDLTWAADKIFASDIEYIRDDIHKKRIAELELENEKLRIALVDKVMAETLLTELNAKNNTINMAFEGGACQLLANAFAEQFNNSGAENYLEVGFTAPDGSPLLVTIQKLYGKTPAQKATAAEAKLKEAEAMQAYIAEVARNMIFDAVINTIVEIFPKSTHQEIFDIENTIKPLLTTQDIITAAKHEYALQTITDIAQATGQYDDLSNPMVKK